MKLRLILIWIFLFMFCLVLAETSTFDVLETKAGPLKITLVGHGSVLFEFNEKVIHVDPFSRVADYTQMPKADLILITHEHGDHLDTGAIEKIKKEDTQILLTQICFDRAEFGSVMKNGDKQKVLGILIEAVPAYNIEHKRDSGEPFHPKNNGNGYVLTFGDKRIYVAGDTENTPEMKALKNIDVAFLPMNVPYTMTPGMVADAAKAFQPRILYPYHRGDTDTNELIELLKDEPGIEVRVR
ncbi:MBL fold metallo-hydrolase [candidate division KSB1 bacterium]|nr:MBL fold metallo-hydrolase [candidate division KSB1 bacterium]